MIINNQLIRIYIIYAYITGMLDVGSSIFDCDGNEQKFIFVCKRYPEEFAIELMECHCRVNRAKFEEGYAFLTHL